MAITRVLATTTWQSSIVTGATLSAVVGNGYWINTTSNACTVTLPASASAGDTISIVDYAGTFATNNITLTSSLKIEGGTLNKLLTTNREGVTVTYVDATQGWVASSGVNSGDQALDPRPYSVDFLVVAGGGGGGTNNAGGGGAGGYRNSYSTEASGGGGSSEASLSFLPSTVYTITIGAGGAVATGGGAVGTSGTNSSISGTGITTITSTGGGGGGYLSANGLNGGSGGGKDGLGTANQGFNGGAGNNSGGGGAGEAGNTDGAGYGGDGLSSSITGSSIARGGGGAGNTAFGGDGGGGGTGVNGTANTGGGGGRDSGNGIGSGGSGVIILRMLDADYSGTTTGSPTVATGVGGTDTVLTFNASGSYTG